MDSRIGVTFFLCSITTTCSLCSSHSWHHGQVASWPSGIMAKWHHVLRVTNLEESGSSILKPLKHAIRTKFFPSLTGQTSPSDQSRELLALPPSFGGLGLINPVDSASLQYQASCQMTPPLVNNIHQQPGEGYTDCDSTQQREKSEVKKIKSSMLKEKIAELTPRLPSSLQRCIQLSQEKGASIWPTTLPLDQHNFSLHKSKFRDAIALCYDLPLSRVPSHCKCGSIFNVEHALSCPTGGYPIIRHNEVRDLTASFLQEVCHDVAVEPTTFDWGEDGP